MADRDTVFFDAGEAQTRRFVAVEVGLVRAFGTGEAEREQGELLSLAQQVAPDPTVFDSFKPWFWRMVASTDREDSYSTKMMPSSLKNYAADYSEGRAFLIGHDKRTIPTGYSLRGKYVAGQGGGVPRTETDLYALQGLPFVDAAVVSMRGGTLRDASISFSGGRWICSIDGFDMLRASWEDCFHFPGMWYRKEPGGVSKKKSSEGDLVKCTAFVEDAHAHEVSGVYDGATPGAGMVKALRAAEAGLLTQRQREVIEGQYRMALPGDGKLYLPAGIESRESGSEEERVGDLAQSNAADGAADTTTPATPPAAGTTAAPPAAENAAAGVSQPQQITADLLAGMVARSEVTEAIRALGIDPGTDPLAAVRAFATGDLVTLRSEADAGRVYRERLIADINKEGVRALGDAFDKAAWSLTLAATREVKLLEAYRDNFARMAAAALPNGRATVDGQQPNPAESANGRADTTPNAAYRA